VLAGVLIWRYTAIRAIRYIIDRKGQAAMTVRLHPVAGKYLDRLPEPQRGKIMDALRGLEKEPPEGNIRPLSGQPGQWRLKVGGYRALYRIEEDTVFVIRGNSKTSVLELQP
jgi:mRNA interferase RelE/StbE